MIDEPNQRQPKGWYPSADFGHVGHCTVCGARLDCREFDQVIEHLHGDEAEMSERMVGRHGGRDGTLRRV